MWFQITNFKILKRIRYLSAFGVTTCKYLLLGGSVTYLTDREYEANKIFIIYYIDTDEMPGFFQ